MQKKTRTIMIDARVVEEYYTHGIACYAYELVSYLILNENTFLKKNLNKQNIKYKILILENSCLKSFSLPNNAEFIIMKSKWTSLIGQLELVKVILKYKPNLFHSPSFIVPLLSFVPLLTTIHDMNHIVLSKYYSFLQKLYYFFLKLRLKINSKVITVSNFSQLEIVKYLNIPKSSIEVIHNGLSNTFKEKSLFTESELIKVKAKYKLPDNYWFAVGNDKPHKNLNMLVETYCKNNWATPLVILSNSYSEIIEIITKYNKNNNVICLDKVKENLDLAQIYAMADLFIFPSIYEGFGFPPLEAMASGSLVLCSKASCLPEIVGPSALYFDPNRVADLEKTINYAISLDKTELAKRKQQGLEWVKQFNWQQSAQQTFQQYFI
jgi:glycosyltransferase involved in cell wall biosynthesis